MNLLKAWSPIHLLCVAAGLAILTNSLAAQTQTTPPLTPAEKRAEAVQAAQAKRAQAIQAAQEKKAQRAAKTPATAAQPVSANGTAPTKTPGNANTARNQTVPGSTTNTVQPGSTAVSRSGQPTAAASAPVGTGTLSWGTRVYTSTGCTHNGNRAVCTFTFVNQGKDANLTAGGAGELSGIQLVDDAHVPHRWDGAYFLDKYGAQQPRLVVQPGDTGTYVVVFPDVNPQVASAEFHLRREVIGGVSVSGAPTTAAATPAAPAK